MTQFRQPAASVRDRLLPMDRSIEACAGARRPSAGTALVGASGRRFPISFADRPAGWHGRKPGPCPPFHRGPTVPVR
jgi:hypothetical protein